MMSKRFISLLAGGFIFFLVSPGTVVAQKLAEGCVLWTDPKDEYHQVLTCPSGRYTTWAAYCEGQRQANIRDYCGGEYCRPPINSLTPDGCLIDR